VPREIRYTILIPALNEAQTVGICVEKARDFLKQTCRENVAWEILVADNGSTDRTREVAEREGARVIHVPERGYGKALTAGFRAARGRFVVMADADDTYSFGDAGLFFEKLEAGYDFVIGNRFRGKIESGAMPPLHRYVGTPVLTLFAKVLFGVKIGDVNCGMRGLSRDAFLRLHLKAGGMEFATEMIAKAAALRVKTTEVPCDLRRGLRNRSPHLRSWRDGWRHLRFMLLFKTFWTFFVPGLILSISGLVGMGMLLFRDILNPGWLPRLDSKHVLSGMMMFLTGMQVIWFGAIAEAYSFSRRFDFGSRPMRAIRKWFSLERGILWGGLFVLAGILIFTYLATSFYSGALPHLTDCLRLDLAGFGITFFLFGVQMVFASFALSFFYLRIK